MAEFRQVHCTFCHQKFVSASSETCALCGNSGCLVNPDSLAALRDVIQAKQAEGRGLRLTVNPRVAFGLFVLLGAIVGVVAAVTTRSVFLFLLVLLSVAGMVVVVHGSFTRNR